MQQAFPQTKLQSLTTYQIVIVSIDTIFSGKYPVRIAWRWIPKDIRTLSSQSEYIKGGYKLLDNKLLFKQHFYLFYMSIKPGSSW